MLLKQLQLLNTLLENRMFSKNKDNIVFEGDFIPDGFVQMSEDEVMLHLNPVPTPEQVKLQRIRELKQLLSSSDFKALPDYQATKTQAENEAIIAQRQAWREEIRELEA